MAGFTAWVDLELDDEDRYDSVLPLAMDDKPQYPCELRMALCGPTLAKLRAAGLEGDPNIGDLIHLKIMAQVTNYSRGENGERIELQPILMALEDEDQEGTGE